MYKYIQYFVVSKWANMKIYEDLVIYESEIMGLSISVCIFLCLYFISVYDLKIPETPNPWVMETLLQLHCIHGKWWSCLGNSRFNLLVGGLGNFQDLLLYIVSICNISPSSLVHSLNKTKIIERNR